MLETLDYFLEPAIPFAIVLWLLWSLFRDDIKEVFGKEDE